MSEKWIASQEAGELMHAAAYRIVADDEDETWVCWADTAEFARQIAHEHNTHAALVEALEAAINCWEVEGLLTLAVENVMRSALAAAKGATSEQR